MPSSFRTVSMFLGICFTSFSALGFGQSEPSTAVKAVFGSHAWTIPVQIDGGKVGNFAISTAQKSSGISAAYFGLKPVDSEPRLGKHRVKIGSVELDDVELLEGVVTGNGDQAGVLGLDLLSKMAIGFDMVRGEWSLWLKGELKESDSRKWIEGVERWSASSAAPKSSQFPIKIDERGVILDVESGSKKIEVSLDTAASYGKLFSPFSTQIKSGAFRAEKALDMDKDGILRLGASFSIGGEEPTWFAHFAVDEKQQQGVSGIGIYDLHARRFMIDFPAKVIYREHSSEDLRLSILLSQVIGLPLSVDGERLRIGPDYLQPIGDALKIVDGKEITSIAGVAPKELLSWLRDQSSTGLAELSKFGFAAAPPFTVEINLDPGTYKLKVNGSG